MAAPWQKPVADLQLATTTWRWQCGFLMAAHGGCFFHHRMLAWNGDCQKGEEACSSHPKTKEAAAHEKP